MPEIEIIRTAVALDHRRALAEGLFGEFVKAVVDVEPGLRAIGGDLHADEEALLLEAGSSRPDLWGGSIPILTSTVRAAASSSTP
jgi:hypothetical protein